MKAWGLLKKVPFFLLKEVHKILANQFHSQMRFRVTQATMIQKKEGGVGKTNMHDLFQEGVGNSRKRLLHKGIKAENTED